MDRITKLVLAVSILILYLTHAISGPFAKFLLILAVVVVALFVAKLFITTTTID